MSFEVVALVSGGKDSIYSALKCEALGHRVQVLANLFPSRAEEQRDSYMYQTQGWELLPSIAACMGLPLETRAIQGKSLNQELAYEKCSEEDEVEDLFRLLEDIKRKYPSVNAVCSGAVLSNYQRTRVENVCERLGLTSLAMLWNRDQKDLLDEMIQNDMSAVLVKVCSMGLEQRHLGKTIKELRDYMFKLDRDFGFHVCGEGGEYETITLDCPLFIKGRIVLDETRVVTLDDRAFSPICVLEVLKHHVEPKSGNDVSSSSSKASTSKATVKSVLAPVSQQLSPSLRIHRGSQQCTWNVGPLFGRSYEEAMRALAESCDHRLDRICFVHLYLRDLTEFGEANKAFEALFRSIPGLSPPARATVELGGLGDFLVIVTAIVASPNESRRVLHVRSRSEWAPQCIGPYSQCNLVGGKLAFIAGQIPLDPATMTLASDLSFNLQLKLALRNCLRIARDSIISAKKGLGMIVYVNSFRSTLEPSVAIEKAAEAFRQVLLADDDADDDRIGPLGDLTELIPVTKTVLLAVPMLPREAEVEIELVAATADGMDAGVDICFGDFVIDSDLEEPLSPLSKLFYVPSGDDDDDEKRPLVGNGEQIVAAIPVQAIGVWNQRRKAMDQMDALRFTILKSDGSV